MPEYTAGVFRREADGQLSDFFIHVEASRVVDGVHACGFWCSLLDDYILQGGATPEEAYREALLTISRLIEHEGIDLVHEDGTPYAVPVPPRPPRKG